MKKKIPLVLIFFTIFNISNAQSFLQKGNDIDGEVSDGNSGWTVSMPDNNTVAIGAKSNNGTGPGAGHVRIYSWIGNAWVQKGLDIDGENANDNSGWSVSMPDNNTVAIGATLNHGNGSYAGHVRVYYWNPANGGTWMQKGIDIDGEAAGDVSGISVSMPDSNTVAIGAYHNYGNGPNAGHVRIYNWNGSAWVQKGTDIDGEAADDNAGLSVSMPDSNTIAIGAVGNDGNGIDAGHVRIYRWHPVNGGVWVQKGIDIDGEAAGDLSGYSVSMPDSNIVAIGAPGNDASGNKAGHIRIYNWNGVAWLQKGIDIDGEAADDNAGFSVSMSDSNTIAIGATSNDGSFIDAGHVRIYSWNGSVWVQKGSDIEGEATGDWSGQSVSMPDSNTVATGAPWNDGSGNNSGHIRVYSTINFVGILENNLCKTLTVYPNPTNGEISIDLGSSYNNIIVNVSNETGQVVHHRIFNNSNLLQLTIPGEAGMYFVDINSGDKKALLKVMKK